MIFDARSATIKQLLLGLYRQYFSYLRQRDYKGLLNVLFRNLGMKKPASAKADAGCVSAD